MTEPELKRRLESLAFESLEECGWCGSYHFLWFSGDCRDDANRFATSEHLMEMWMAGPRLLEIFRRIHNRRQERRPVEHQLDRGEEILKEIE